eukprot:TRINITY_DN212_c0_g1_i1.p1 TRINITY_DN212_c0_g1~~TRINITY_DN212_c0_g1_i1.p1  ORF type:complete len:159 (+),score=5.77 TRINITY_DN212_c0_g1_i1:150-626(+)
MANSLCFTSVNSFKSPIKPGNSSSVLLYPNSLNLFFSTKHQPPSLLLGLRIGSESRTIRLAHGAFLNVPSANFNTIRAKATDSNQSKKVNSIVCPDCDGNGALLCSQCKGNGVNSVDHFNGQFKAGGLCWLCRGKRDILCGNCNGAGFLGGFMSSMDE